MTHIPNELLEQITGLIGARFEASRHEKRSQPRIALPSSIRVIPVVHGLPTPDVKARLRDVSSTGLSILCDHPLRPGDSFLINLPRKNHPPVWALCQVTRSQTADKGIHLIGAKFLGFKLHYPPESTPPSLPLAA